MRVNVFTEKVDVDDGYNNGYGGNNNDDDHDDYGDDDDDNDDTDGTKDHDHGIHHSSDSVVLCEYTLLSLNSIGTLGNGNFVTLRKSHAPYICVFVSLLLQWFIHNSYECMGNCFV